MLDLTYSGSSELIYILQIEILHEKTFHSSTNIPIINLKCGSREEWPSYVSFPWCTRNVNVHSAMMRSDLIQSKTWHGKGYFWFDFFFYEETILIKQIKFLFYIFIHVWKPLNHASPFLSSKIFKNNHFL